MAFAAVAKKYFEACAGGAQIQLPANIRSLTGFVPEAHQHEMLSDFDQFNVVLAHRRFGKSYADVMFVFERAVECPFPDPCYLIVAATLDQARKIAWKQMVRIAQSLPGGQIHKALWEVSVPARNGTRATIGIYGCEKSGEHSRGAYLDGVLLTEAAFMPPAYFESQIIPMLLRREGVDRDGYPNQWAILESTVAGRFNWFWEAYERADKWQRGLTVIERDPESGERKSSEQKNWRAFNYKASDTRIIPSDKLSMLKFKMSTAAFRREFENDPDAALGGAIYGAEIAKLRKDGRLTKVDPISDTAINTAWDLGDFPGSTAIVFFQVSPRGTPLVIDELEENNKKADWFVREIKKKGYRYGLHIMPWDAAVENVAVTEGPFEEQCRAAGLRGIELIKTPAGGRKRRRDFAARWLDRARFDEQKTQRMVAALSLYRKHFDSVTQQWSNEPVGDWTCHFADAWGMAAWWLEREYRNRNA